MTRRVLAGSRLVDFNARQFEVLAFTLFTGASLVFAGCKRDPICVLPPRHAFRIEPTQIPPSIVNTFHTVTTNEPILRAEICVAGDRFLFYCLRFKKGNEVNEVLINPQGKIEMAYPVLDK